MAKRPNLLFITCDQWRGECLSAAGHSVVRTPNADALAKEGVLFRRHYAGAAPCSPARASIYTGLYQMNNRVCRNGTPMDARHYTLAQAARALGYDPTLFGYTDVSPDPRNFPANDPLLKTYEGVLPGFTVRQLLPEHQKQWLSWLREQGVSVEHGFPDIHRPANGDVSRVSKATPIYSRQQTPAAFLTNEFLRWHGEQDEPWFAHISYLSPHPPFIVPEPFNSMYDPSQGSGFSRAESWEDEARSHPYVQYELEKQRRGKFLPGHDGMVRDLSEEEFRTIRSIYYGMISEVDDQLGRIWSALKATDEWQNTIIVLTSDHAEMMGDHFMLGKGGYFDQSYHLPLIIRAPGHVHDAQVEHFTEAVDLMPTVIELLGGQAPDHLDGCSLAPFLYGAEPAVWRDAAHWEFDFRSISDGPENQPFGLKPQQCNLAVVRTATHKYVHFNGGLPPLLFDLVNDPGELENRAHDPAYAGVRIEMAERLLAWRAEHLDQTLALSELTANGVAGTFAGQKESPRW
ncbi:MAG: alkaline phosphatase family protein [Rhizobiaceae bacterium]|nr:alkaline phosphatase family protein [Rhizobiaceae bacterium]